MSEESDKKTLFNENNVVLDANKQTQKFSASSTIEKYDWQVGNKDFAAVSPSYNNWNLYFPQANLAIQTCLKKLNFGMDNLKLNPQDMKNCIHKIKTAQEFFVGH